MTDAEADAGPRVLEGPSAEAAASAIEDALSAGRAVSLGGRCAVGRGDGAAGPDGDYRRRHVLVTPDGTAVVHGTSGTSPVATLGRESGVDAGVVGGRLRLVAGRGESVEFDAVDILVTLPMAAEAGSDPRAGAHATLRERLLDDPDLVEGGFTPRATERETPAGPVDLFGRDAEGRAVVVEVKAHRAGPAAVGQLDRYVSALRRDLHADAEVRGVLVAPSATERTRQLLADRGFELRLLPSGGG